MNEPSGAQGLNFFEFMAWAVIGLTLVVILNIGIEAIRRMFEGRCS